MSKKKLQETLSREALEAALGNYLSSWDASPEDVISALDTGLDSDLIRCGITIWAPFVNYDTNWIADHIETLAGEIEEVAKRYRKLK